MTEYKYLIIGGGVAGTTAAGTLRQKDSDSSIAIISDEPHYLYSRLMLSKPNFFLGKIPFDQIWLRNEAWYKDNRIDFIGGKTAVELDSDNQTVLLNDKTTLKYDKLLLATGVCPRSLPVPGVDKQGVFYLRTLDQGKGIIDSITNVKQAVVIGGGFIGFEMSNLLRLSNAAVTLILRESRIWENIFDPTASQIVENAMENAGVTILRQTETKEINGDKSVTGVTLADNTTLPAQMIICGIGALCNIDWLKRSNLKADRGILANEQLQTNLPNIWAAGDAAQFSDPILEEEVQLGNWVNAQEQGRIAALNMTGVDTPFTFVSFYTTHGFDLSITIVGNARPQKEFTTITRHGPADNQHGQLMLVNGELVGAILINQTNTLQILTKLIQQNVKVDDKQDILSNPNSDLNSLLTN